MMPRKSISAEAFGEFNKHEALFVHKIVEKPSQIKEK
jgi:hypothetical protein